MKLRRAMALAAATAAIAPLALLSAPAAFAEETPSPTATVSETASEPASATPTETTPAPTETPSASATETTPASSATATTSTSATPPAPSTSAPAPSDTPEPEPSECQDSKVDVSISGLPGKIAAGSGWHKFSLNVLNNSKSTLKEPGFFAGASADKAGEDIFESKKVQLQAYNEDTKAWEDVDSEGYAAGFVGYTPELKPDYEVDIPLRINVKSSAPVGVGFSLGASIYGDADGSCTGFGEVAYKFQIVSAGTDTNGTKPQEGGKVPVSDKPADKGNTPVVNGSLAETGSSSALPTIALVGGLAVVAGAGAVFVVRRRKSGDATA
ncbi:LPXTG cell wall anchor domain-containing protein [Streptomyces sp. RLB3-17]|uniref:LPXTG cell wall anchor domain-containing protein n=1 Tax=Streptomyces mirabilis TaxID=68239 RepID=A0ABU3UMI0_9ACTN|nr:MULTISPECIES: LAETG motif-containing sortase-dependent surface protein [Streptomyces]MCX5351394.1 LPXTG cell wall anchor domain-containing protein [Streptomyces mirabilis]MDU8995127.1 LPXTG cell wall anchor domain-containing protein [Streptomyces mirabilis]NMI60373.1 LPXTG cell wall anchor domain-containing protein [Streptomyces sp. RLA2-12]QDN59546.1 LPXTG cell wall anchor domain-containing protein [Streptomyces sp. S1D4-20]QDN69622.1 LPXTG cell wall anchor domain-containing protein [Strep